MANKKYYEVNFLYGKPKQPKERATYQCRADNLKHALFITMTNINEWSESFNNEKLTEISITEY